MLIPVGTQLTPQLLQRIAAYNSTLSRALRQRGMKRREVLLQVRGVAWEEGEGLVGFWGGGLGGRGLRDCGG